MNPSARFCTHCGAFLGAAARYCSQCGSSQPVSSAATGGGVPTPTAGTPGIAGRYIVFGIAALVLAFGFWLFWESQQPIPQFDQASYDETMGAAMRERLQQALRAPETVTKFELNGGKFTSLPAEFTKLQNLRELAIHDNAALDYPGALRLLAQIPTLERLDLAENNLQLLPAEIGGLTNLKELLLWNNELQSLPEEIGTLQKLEWINLARNSLESLPAGLAKLPGLTHMDLSQNRLKAVPRAVFELPALKSLDLSRNQDLTSLPASIANLKELEFLGLAFNSELKRLPAELAQLPKLAEITGLYAGFLDAPETAELGKAMKNTRISGKAEGQLINQMQRTEIEAAKIEKEREEKKK